MNRDDIYVAIRAALAKGNGDVLRMLDSMLALQTHRDATAARDAGWREFDVCFIPEPPSWTALDPADGVRRTVPMGDLPVTIEIDRLLND